MSQDAFGAGAVPDPKDVADRPVKGWLWRDQFIVADEQVAGFSRSQQSGAEVRMDLRGRRKLEASELVLIAENTATEGSSFSVRISGIIRCVALLP